MHEQMGASNTGRPADDLSQNLTICSIFADNPRNRSAMAKRKTAISPSEPVLGLAVMTDGER